MFYCININDKNIPSFIINDENSVIESVIIKDLCYKKMNKLNILYDFILFSNIFSHVMIVNIWLVYTKRGRVCSRRRRSINYTSLDSS
jgi:hypothetical protein